MRLRIGLGVLLAGCAGAQAQEAKPPPRTAPNFAASLALSPSMQRQHEESLNRQAAMDKRMDARTRHAIGSVCVGCSGPVARAVRARPDVVPEEPINEASAFDPAEAPVD